MHCDSQGATRGASRDAQCLANCDASRDVTPDRMGCKGSPLREVSANPRSDASKMSTGKNAAQAGYERQCACKIGAARAMLTIIVQAQYASSACVCRA